MYELWEELKIKTKIKVKGFLKKNELGYTIDKNDSRLL